MFSLDHRARIGLAVALLALAQRSHAMSIDATIDGAPYTCSAADAIDFTVEYGPIWSWTCGESQVSCVQMSGPDATYDLQSGTVAFSCMTSTPANYVVFEHGFE